jgi:hypothetical protein
MRRTRALLIMILVLLPGLLVGCGPVNSLNPLFTDQNLIFDDALLGEWTERGPDRGSLRFEQAGPRTYRVTNVEPDGKGGPPRETTYEVHLVRLGAYRFLDVAPLEMTAASDTQALGPWPVPSEQTRLAPIADGFYVELTGVSAGVNSAGQANLRRGHWIFRLDTSRRTLKLAALDADWLRDALGRGEVGIAHAFVDSDNKEFVITAEPGDLQELVLEHARDEEAFPETTEFRKRK